MRERAGGLGLEVSLRTVQRIARGQVRPLQSVAAGEGVGTVRGAARRARAGEGPVLVLGEEERAKIADILRRAARAGYLEVEGFRFEARPGEISFRARVYEPEDEYE